MDTASSSTSFCSSASASGTTTPFAGATFTQATRIEVPVHVLEQFAQQNTIDNEILGDLRAAVVELHDRMQHRTNILGTTTTSLADGHNLVVENLGRLQQGLDAHSEVITRLVQDNRGIHDELEATRAQLEEVRTMAQTPRLGPEQWQAQVEAHILKLQNEFDMRMKQVDDDHHSTKSRVRNLEDRAVSRTEVPDAHMVQEQVDETFSAVQHLRSVVEAKHLELDNGLAEARESIQDLSNTQRKVEKSLDHLQALCEQFAMNSDGEEQADEQYLDAYEGSWWGNQAGLQGQEEPERPPGLTSSSVPSSRQAWKPLDEPIGGPSGQNPAPAEGRDTSQEQGNAIHHARWKLLADVPSLQVGSGEPWEVGMRFRTWLKQLHHSTRFWYFRGSAGSVGGATSWREDGWLGHFGTAAGCGSTRF